MSKERKRLRKEQIIWTAGTCLLCVLALFCYAQGRHALAWEMPWPFAQRQTKVRLEGLATRLDESRWRVGDQIVHLAQPSSDAYPALQEDAWVIVEALPTKADGFQLQSVAADAPDTVVEFTGIISARPTNELYGTWKIDDQDLGVDANTFLSPDSEMRVGQVVQVKATHLPGKPLHAQQITRQTSFAASPVQLEGKIVRLPNTENWAGMWLVDHVPVMVNAKTRITGAPQIGAFVEVSGQPVENGSLQADTLTISESPNKARRFQGDFLSLTLGPDTMQIEAQILAANGKREWRRFHMDENTFIDESRASAQSAAKVEIRAEQQVDGSWWARYVRFYRE